jgi:hypothetical protein
MKHEPVVDLHGLGRRARARGQRRKQRVKACEDSGELGTIAARRHRWRVRAFRLRAAA